jgi:hypothetical protein
MELVRRLFTFLLTGIVLGAVVASLFAPGYLVWYNTPGTGSAMCNCTDVTRETASSMMRAQITGSAIGGALFLILGIVLSIRGRRRPPPALEAQSPRSSSGSSSTASSSTSSPAQPTR